MKSPILSEPVSSSIVIDMHNGEVLSGQNFTRRQILAGGLLSLGSLALHSCATTSRFVSSKIIEVTSHHITIPHLPAAFDGIRVTVASNFHSSIHMTPKELQHIVRRINELNSDMILLCGDYITSLRSEIPPIFETFHELNAPLGIYAVTGNHDHDVDADLLSKGMEEIGVKVLRNDNHSIDIACEKIYLLGIDDDNSD